MIGRLIILSSLLLAGSQAAYQNVRYQNWRHLSRDNPFCTPPECDLSEFGEVSVDEIEGCLSILKKQCRFSVQAVHTYAAQFRDSFSYICWAPDQGPNGVSGLSVPGFYPEKEFMEYGEDLDGQIELQFLGLNTPKDKTCDLFLINQDVRFERGCGWDIEGTNYEALIPAAPFYRFKEGERKLMIQGSKLKELLHSMGGPGLFFLFTEPDCSAPLTAYSFSFHANLSLKANNSHGLLKTFSAISLLSSLLLFW